MTGKIRSRGGKKKRSKSAQSLLGMQGQEWFETHQKKLWGTHCCIGAALIISG
jgi:hypothetical protein